MAIKLLRSALIFLMGIIFIVYPDFARSSFFRRKEDFTIPSITQQQYYYSQYYVQSVEKFTDQISILDSGYLFNFAALLVYLSSQGSRFCFTLALPGRGQDLLRFSPPRDEASRELRVSLSFWSHRTIILPVRGSFDCLLPVVVKGMYWLQLFIFPTTGVLRLCLVVKSLCIVICDRLV